MISAHSQVGHKHDKNDDAILAVQGRGYSFLLVCDGVSSTPRGGWLAELVCYYVEYMVQKDKRFSYQSLEKILTYVDWVSRRLGRGQAACTLSLVYIEKGRGWVASLGDSPVVMCSKEGLQNKNLRWLVNKEKGSGLREFVGMGKNILSSVLYQEF